MAKGTKNPVGKAVVWIILLLLIVGLAGFGATSFGGSTRVVGSVGDTEIDIDRYARALQQEIRALEAQTGQRISMSEARQYGLDQIVLQRLVALAALEDEAGELGLSVGDDEVARSIQDMQAFQGVDGSFDREAYAFSLDRAGLSVAEFEDQLRGETARSLLQGAVIAGIQPPAAFVDTLYEYARETRDLTLVRFVPEDPQSTPAEPDEDALTAYYEANPEAYTLPRRKRITYAWLSPDMLAESVPVEDAAVQDLYDQRSDEYDRPETRLVERLVFSDDAAAAAAAESIASGDTDFDTLVEERGLSLDDVDLGTVGASDLGAASESVFALDAPGIAGPAPTPLGPALFRVNAILAPQQTPLEDVEDELRAELSAGAARRAADAQIEPVSDLLAGGATLEDVAEETEFQLGETIWSGGEAGEDGADIDAYEEFRELAAAAEPGDFPEVAQLSDGGLFALRVDEILEPALQDLDTVRDQVVQDWAAAERRAQLVQTATEAQARLDDGTAIDAIGGTVTRQEGVLRDAYLEGLPDDAVATAFGLQEGASQVIETADGALLIRADAVSVPGGATEEAQAIKEGVRTAAGQGIAQDITSAFTSALETRKGITLNSQAVSAVLSQFN